MSKLQSEQVDTLWSKFLTWINSKKVLGILISTFVFIAPELGINVDIINDIINSTIGTTSEFYDEVIALIAAAVAFWQATKEKISKVITKE